jgi:hypothetical protein
LKDGDDRHENNKPDTDNQQERFLLQHDWVLEQMQNLRVVHLEEYASQLASNRGVARSDERVQVVFQNMLLFLGRG